MLQACSRQVPGSNKMTEDFRGFPQPLYYNTKKNFKSGPDLSFCILSSINGSLDDR
jgi:hypothetical protein